MVDRGGLNYPIRVRDEFSKTTAKFREELRASKKAFREFQSDLQSQRGSSRALRETAEASRALAAAKRDQGRAVRSSTKPLTEEEALLRRLALASKEQSRREREAVRLRNAQTADARRRATQERQAARDRERAEKQRQKAIEATSRAEQRALTASQRALQAQTRAEQERQRVANRIFKQQQKDAAARIAQQIDQQKRAEQLNRQLQKLQKAEQAARDRADSQVQAERRLNRELFQRQITLKQIELLRARSKAQFVGGDILGGRDSLRRAQELQKSLEGSQRAASGFLFTFRRLVGVLAIFTLARRGVQVFQDLIASGVKFNDTIETSRIGVAGLVATLGDVRNEFGQSVDQADELQLALGLADEQILKLRQDSLRTVATFEELLDTFQIAVGPGLAAGLNLDEIRQLTVDISQAASALGVPQNQLAEEVRSLLSGTIQARTTRIATALGITNADIRRLRETGELFDFLEERFSGFAAAAERQARQTLSGISTLVRGATNELLGQAAQPLFEELLSLGNELFDEVITITDAAGNIRPNPEAVSAFRSLFNALRDGLRSLRDFAEGFGFEGLENLVTTIGSGLNIGIQAAIGFAESLGATFNIVASVVRGVTGALGLTAQRVGQIAGFVGQALTVLILFRSTSRLIGLEWRSIVALMKKVGPSLKANVAPAAILAASFVAIGKVLEFILQNIFKVDLSLKDTIQLVSLGLYGALLSVAEVLKVLGESIGTGLQNALDTIISAAREKALGARAFIAQLFGNDDEAVRLFQEQERVRLEAENRIAARRKQSEVEIADIRAQAEAKQLAINEEIAGIVGKAAGEAAQGAGFDVTFDPATAAKEAAEAAETFVSTADKPINELAEGLLKVNDELVKARLEFEQAGRVAGLGGFSQQVEGIFNQQEIENADRLRQIRAELAKTEEKIATLRAQGVQDDEGALVTLLRDEKDLRDAINIALDTANDLALTRAATEATQLLPTLAEETALLRAQVAAERAVTAAKVNDLDVRQQALVAAQTAVGLAQAEAEIARQKAQAELTALQTRIQSLPAGDERAALESVLDALTMRRDMEAEILALRLQQLAAAQREAELAANGSMTEGLREGFMQFAEEFSSTFEAGVQIARQSTQALASFVSSAIVDAFDPTKDESLKERFARFMQQIATIILQQLVQLAIAKAILGFKDGGVVPELNVPGFSFARGGKVGRKGDKRLPVHAFAPGFAGGGGIGGISPLDTVPAMLRPGEFVVRKEAVDALGLGTMEAINGGNFPVTGSSAAEAASPSMGMQTGGLVSDRLEQLRSAGANEGGGVTVVPAVVARDREMDQLTAGGRNALLAFMRENSTNINILLDRGASRG